MILKFDLILTNLLFLKPANILINKNTYKIADFGFARMLGDYSFQAMQSKVGSPLYMAPQVLIR